MPIKLIAANPKVHENIGRVAVTRGPIVYCAEGVDNGQDIHSILLDPKGKFTLSDRDFILPSIKTTAHKPVDTDALYFTADETFEEIPLTLIPYFAFANRGESDMLVWIPRK
jgi:DUF1680 family protein